MGDKAPPVVAKCGGLRHQNWAKYAWCPVTGNSTKSSFSSRSSWGWYSFWT